MIEVRKYLTGGIWCTFVGITGCLALPASAKAPDAVSLFATLPPGVQSSLPAQAIAGRSNKVKINRQKLRQGRFSVSLPGGVSFDVVREQQHEMGNGRFAWVGHASDNRDSQTVVGVSGNAVAATFYYRKKLFKLEPRANGTHILSEVKATEPAPEIEPIPVGDAGNSIPIPGKATTTTTTSSGPVIDVLVAYTPAIRALYGAEGADAMIIQAVAETNQAYVNSGMNTRLNLVKSVMTNYTESGNMTTDLGRLRNTGDGYMDELHALRNTYGADLVSLIENDPQYCGIAYRMTSLSTSFASNAFSVIHHDCATGYYSFAHELGHNQGAHHDPASGATGAIYPYAYGYQDPSRAFRTIMAYDCPGGCPRIPHFSNAQINWNGRPTGYLGAAENALAIMATDDTVAAFRQAVAQPPQSAPSNLKVIAINGATIDLGWTDNSSNESGFYLERSDDGETFTQIASLPANTTHYIDDGLLLATLYSYRIMAWNSTGTTAYSDELFAAISRPPGC